MSQNSRIRVDPTKMTYLPLFTETIVGQYTAAVKDAMRLRQRAERQKAMESTEPLARQLRDLLTHPEEETAYEQIDTLLNSDLSPYTNYLASLGVEVPPTDEMEEGNGTGSGAGRHRDKASRDEAYNNHIKETGAELWKLIAKHALDINKKEEALLTPILELLLNEAFSVQQRMNGEGDGSANAKPKQLPLGEGLDQAKERIREWTETATACELKVFAPVFQPSFAGDLVAKNSRLLATPETLLQIAPIFECSMASAADNAHLTESSWHTLADLALVQTGMTRNNRAKTGDLRRFWRKAAQKGFALNRQQVHVARMIAQQAAVPEVKYDDGLEIALTIAHIREAGRDELFQEEILTLRGAESKGAELGPERGRATLLAQLLRTNQGRGWARIAMELANPKNERNLQTPEIVEAICEALEETEEWNLKGVSEMDLLALVGSDNERIRAHGRRLMTRAGDCTALNQSIVEACQSA